MVKEQDCKTIIVWEEKQMLRNTNAEMVLPMNAVKMTEDEMMYVEGGGVGPRTAKRLAAEAAKKAAIKSAVSGGVTAVGVALQVLGYQASTPYSKYRNGGRNSGNVSYEPTPGLKSFGKACTFIGG